MGIKNRTAAALAGTDHLESVVGWALGAKRTNERTEVEEEHGASAWSGCTVELWPITREMMRPESQTFTTTLLCYLSERRPWARKLGRERAFASHRIPRDLSVNFT